MRDTSHRYFRVGDENCHFKLLFGFWNSNSKVTSRVGSLDNVRKTPRSGTEDSNSPVSNQMDGPKKPTRRVSQNVIPTQKYVQYLNSSLQYIVDCSRANQFLW